MSTNADQYIARAVENKIYSLRGQKIILDRDLAVLYEVPTFRFNEAVKRNRGRFPEDFLFQLTKEEFASLISQIAISKRDLYDRIRPLLLPPPEKPKRRIGFLDESGARYRTN
jgi:hypothetical protein